VSPRLPRVTGADLVRALERDGWLRHHQVGSHLVLRHATKPGRVVVAMHAGLTIGPGLLAKTLKDASLTADDLRRLL
jgi:predicted RNA binding protein YcfA (HicA-like mRNA interferase family)